MTAEPLAIPEVLLIAPPRFADLRGFFSETWSQRRYTEYGIPGPFVQDNHSLSVQRGTIRGLHAQIAPSVQGKLVRCVRGAIWDVAVDIRRSSPSYGRHVAAELSAENWHQLWIPGGFLHGFCTLAPDTEVIYKVTADYDRKAERGVIWNDPDLALPWPVGAGEALLSDKDRVLPRFADCVEWFLGVTILITGGTGQLASALSATGTERVYRVGRPAFDFDKPDSVASVFDAVRPALVVNAAAYTGVDVAETDAGAAYRANRDGPAQLARLCAEAGVPLIHVSTDYVFDGLKGAPYVETDPTEPQGIYGASKLAGEGAVLNACSRAIVLRTAWVYSATGKNFVRTMLNAARKTDRLRVVADQKGCPTTASDLAEAILAVAARIEAEGWQDRFGGIFHAAGTGWTTWHGLAVATFREAARHGLTPPVVEPIATADWPTPVRRPPDSRLDCAKLAAVFGVRLPHWRDSVGPTVDALMAADQR